MTDDNDFNTVVIEAGSTVHMTHVRALTPEDLTIDQNEQIARAIVATGGQILLAYDAGDAGVRFKSRRDLVRQITDALDAALEDGSYT